MVLDEDERLGSEQDVLDVLGRAYGEFPDLIAIPAAALGPRFFDLSTRIAGDLLQKFAQYRMRVAILGDLSAYVAASSALRDFVYESNRGGQIWFLADFDALDARLAQVAARA
jgi:hypothetical protein